MVFTREESEIINVAYLPPLGKSDHLVLDINMRTECNYLKKEESNAENKLKF